MISPDTCFLILFSNLGPALFDFVDDNNSTKFRDPSRVCKQAKFVVPLNDLPQLMPFTTQSLRFFKN